MKFATAWEIAYRFTDKNLLLNKNFKDKFIPIQNTFTFWGADPFPFYHNGKLYVFAELYDYILHRGRIGYCVYENGSFSKWKTAIKEPFHLSFPYIFTVDDNVYIIPESNHNRDLRVYRAKSFPDTWKVVKTYEIGRYVDSVLYKIEGVNYVLSTHLIETDKAQLEVFRLGEDGISEIKKITEDSTMFRNAGKIVQKDNKNFRVFQDCSDGYGMKIGFSEILICNEEMYEEKFIDFINISNLNIKTKREIKGIHTYNNVGEFEIIDYKYDDKSVLGVLLQVMRNIVSLLRKK